MCMRKFINAAIGYRERVGEQWEQARMVAWYSAFDRKPMRLTDIHIPGDGLTKLGGASQENKEEAYKLLEKWSK